MTFRLIAAALLAPLLVSQGTFEGRLQMRSIDLEIEESGLKESWLDLAPNAAAAREGADVEETELWVKINVLRFAGKSEASGFGLLDFTRHVMVMVDRGSKIYFEVPLPAGSGETATPKPGATLVKPLGKTKTLNGVSVTGYEVRSDDQILRAWMTKDFPGLTGAFRSVAAKMGETDDPEDAAVTELMKYGFPVLMITLTDRSVRYEEMVSIERGPQSADLFKVPAGFTKQTLPGGP